MTASTDPRFEHGASKSNLKTVSVRAHCLHAKRNRGAHCLNQTQGNANITTHFFVQEEHLQSSIRAMKNVGCGICGEGQKVCSSFNFSFRLSYPLPDDFPMRGLAPMGII